MRIHLTGVGLSAVGHGCFDREAFRAVFAPIRVHRNILVREGFKATLYVPIATDVTQEGRRYKGGKTEARIGGRTQKDSEVFEATERVPLGFEHFLRRLLDIDVLFLAKHCSPHVGTTLTLH